MTWRTCLFVFLAAAIPALGETAVATTICGIVQSPEQFDGKLVRVRGTVLSGFEIFAVRDAVDTDCRVALEYAGGGAVASTSFGEATPNIDGAPLALRKDAAFERFERALEAEMYPRERGLTCVACHRYEVTAMLTGRIDVAGERQGFGHMNMFRVRFVLAGVEDVIARDRASEYDPDDYSPTPVRFAGGTVSGRLLDPDGKPVHGAQIDLVSTEDVPLYLKDFTEWTDAKGRFSIEAPPGTYVLSVNGKEPPSAEFPFPPIWYPGASDASSAQRIELRDRQRIRGLVIRPPRRLELQHVPVLVLWPDGRPVPDANVWLAEVARPTYVVGHAVSHTREDGTFELPGFPGIAYVVRANIYVKPFYKPYCAEPRRLDAIPSERLTMVLTYTGEVCRSSDWMGDGATPLTPP